MRRAGKYALRFLFPAVTLMAVTGSPAEQAPPAIASVPAAQPTAQEVETAVAAVYPALVNISAVSREFAEGRAMRFPSAGSGVLVSKEGHVLTNFHVAGHSTRIRCTLTDGRIFEADVVAHDPLTDLSVLKLRLDAGHGNGGGGSASADLRPARLAVDAKVAIGDPVLALGNPFALSSSVTLGIVSNAHRVFTDFTGSELTDVELDGGETTGWLTQWIQHDALILPGNSGGPLVNLSGEVIGINELGGGGIGFAIPARVAADVLRHALADGAVRRGFLGFSALPVAKLGRESGALVSSVLAGSPAAKAGLEAGDILLSLNGEKVEARFFEQVPELYRRVADLPVGAVARLSIERQGEARELSAKTEEMERLKGDEGEIRALGLSAEELTAASALARNLSVRKGLLVTGLRPGQAAATARPQIQVGDVLLAVDGRSVTTLAALDAVLVEPAATPVSPAGATAPASTVASGSVAAGERRGRVLKVLRGDQEILALARLPEKRNGRWGGELPRAWLGVQTQVLTPELAEALGKTGSHGFRVSEVYPWTNAEKAGVAVGDLLTALNGEAFDASRPQDGDDLRRAIEAHRIGESVHLTILRDDRPRDISVQLESRPEASDETRRSRQEDFEFAVRELTLLDRSDRHWTRDQAGVLVTDVTSGGWAHMAGLRIDDLILSLNGTEVRDVGAFEHRVAELTAARANLVEVFIRRGSGTHFVFIEPEWPEGKRP
ncbi:MAG: PDZ domain-containing protein [Thermoanaerobaculia bacterium]